MLKILGKTTSINVRKVLWACEEIGIAYTQEDWGSGFRSTATAEFLALNPNGLVPVIQDGDEALWESNTILRYLAAKHGRQDLLPAAPGPRAQVEKWMDWQAGDFNNAWRYAFQALVRNNPDCTDKAALAASIADWTAKLALLDRQLQTTGAFVAGPAFSIADIPVGLSVNRWFMTPLQHPEFPAVTAYYDRLGLRPAFLRHGRNGIP